MLRDIHVAFLGPFDVGALGPYIDSLTEADVQRTPGMGGHGLVPLVVGNILAGRQTTVITLDPHLVEDEIVERVCGKSRLMILPRRRSGTRRDFYRTERALIREAIRSINPDVVHAHWTYEYALGALDVTPSRPTLITIRDHAFDILRYLAFNYWLEFFAAMAVYRRGAAFTTVSPNVYGLAAKLTGAPVWMVPNPAPDGLFEVPLRPLSQTVNILSTTQWTRVKNPHSAIRAFAILRRDIPDSTLHLCGSGMEEGGVANAWALELGVTEGIHYHGSLRHVDLMGLMRSADVYLHTARTEACNTAVVEAMALGKPVVGGRRSGGIPWQLDYGNAGLLVDIEDPAKIALAIKQIVQKTDLRETMAKNARAYARKMNGTSIVLDKYDQIYRRIMNSA
jgi:L-malate glycosyltransferase